MRYAYSDLGRRRQGSTAVVHWKGTGAAVMLFDSVNFAKYVGRLPSSCDDGGHYRCSPARLSIPDDGHWFAVVDLGANTASRPPMVEIVDPDGSQETVGSQPVAA